MKYFGFNLYWPWTRHIGFSVRWRGPKNAYRFIMRHVWARSFVYDNKPCGAKAHSHVQLMWGNVAENERNTAFINNNEWDKVTNYQWGCKTFI
jgi:hypothetical protein